MFFAFIRNMAYTVSNKVLEALSLFKLQFVREYLLFPDARSDVFILTNTVQRQASVLINTHRVMWGVPSLEFEVFSNWLYTPAYSQGTVTVGCIIQNLHLRAAPHLMSSKQAGYSMRRFVLDSATGQQLTVGYPTSEGTIEITSLSFFSTAHPTAFVMRVEALHEAIDADLNPWLVRRAILFMFLHREKRECPICDVICVCRRSLAVPKHSLDFSSFIGLVAATAGVYSGFGNQHMVVGGLERPNSRPMGFQCTVRKLKNASGITEMWKWGVTSRFNELPIYPTKLTMPQIEIEPLPSNHSIIDELEEYQRVSFSSEGLLQQAQHFLPQRTTLQRRAEGEFANNQIPEISQECTQFSDLEPCACKNSTAKSGAVHNINIEQIVLSPTNPADSSISSKTPLTLTVSMLMQASNEPSLPTVAVSDRSIIQNTTLLAIDGAARKCSRLNPSTMIHSEYQSTTQNSINVQPPLQPDHKLSKLPLHSLSSQTIHLAICKPISKQYSATPIAVSPIAPPIQTCTYVTEREKQLLERKERNRRSAARSNTKKREAFLELERNLIEETQKMKELLERQKKLKREKALLKEKIKLRSSSSI